MRKLLSFLLVIITLLSLFSCTHAEAGENLISNENAEKLAAEEGYVSTATLYATEGTYVRGGNYKNTVPSQLPQLDYYFLKYDVVENTFRTPILKFDISDFEIPENTKSISLVVDFYTTSSVHENFAGEV